MDVTRGSGVERGEKRRSPDEHLRYPGSAIPHVAALLRATRYSLRSKSRRESAMSNGRIETNPDIMDGKPVIRGTRIPVDLILRKLSAGVSPGAILADHPRLTLDDISAAQES
jgi:uncharacterized protein (DUF433 family)